MSNSAEPKLTNGTLTLKDKQFSDLDSDFLLMNSHKILKLEIRDSEILNLDSTSIFSLCNLISLDLRNNKLELLSEQFSLFHSLQVLKLDHNYLTGLPSELFDLPLIFLSLSYNSLFTLNGKIVNLVNLTHLSIAENHLSEVPIELGYMKSLKTLLLHGNEFAELPCSLGLLDMLEELTLEWLHYTMPICSKFLKSEGNNGKLWELKGLMAYKLQRRQKYLKLGEFLHVFSEKDFDIHKIDARNRNLIHLSCINSDLGVLKGLIEAGCDINLIDSDDFTPLLTSLKEDNLKASKLLIQAGAQYDIGGGIFGSALNLAVIKSDPWIVKEILKSNQYCDMNDSNGNTCLHHLMSLFKKHKHKNELIADLLVKAGVRLNQYNNDNWTALHIAARKGQNSAIRWVAKVNSELKKAGKETFDLNALGGKYGWSPLHLAATTGNYKTVMSLISAGAEVYIKNHEGKTPKNTSKGDIAVFKYLKRLEKEHIKLLIHTKQTPKKTPDELPLGIELDYKNLYSHFKTNNSHGIENYVKYGAHPIVKADAVYLLNQLKERKNFSILMRVTGEDSYLIKQEMINASQIKPWIDGRHSINRHRFIGPRLSRSNPPRLSLPVSSPNYFDEETSTDSLLIV